MKKRTTYKQSYYQTYSIASRYLVLLLITAFSLPLIYKIFTPLTINLSATLLKTIYQTTINNTIITIESTTLIEIIPACVAGSAYLLLLILNLSIPMKINKRVKTILISFLLLFTLNILRIFILIILYHNEVAYVDFTHKLFWYVLSTVFVVLIWFFIVKLYSIKVIPVYTDLKYLSKNINFSS